MKNMVVLQLNDDGNLHCRQLTDEGVEFVREFGKTQGTRDPYWEEGGTIVLDELIEILNKER